MPKQTLRRIYAVLTGALVVGATITAVALAHASQTPTVTAANNAKLQESVLLDAQGRTLYALNPETSGHLLCKSASCTHVWPPLTVSSGSVKLKAGAGVHGTLGLLHRAGGAWQVTLRGLPLYRFSGDHGKDESNGEGLQSFGGTWHAVTAATSAGSKPTTQAAPMAPATSSEPYAPSSPSGSSTSTSAAPSTPTTSTPTYTYPAY